MAIQAKDSSQHSHTEDVSSLATPRMLLVATPTSNGSYQTIFVNDQFLLLEDEGGMTPPELFMETTGDTLTIGFQFLRGNSQYFFVPVDTELVCVGGVQFFSTGSELWEVEIDLIKNMATRYHGAIDAEHLSKDPDILISRHEPITLRTMRKAMTLEIAPGIFL